MNKCIEDKRGERGKMEKVNLDKKFSLFDEYWSPKVVGELNGQFVKIAKLKGEFIWHQHESEDEFFMVIRGQLTIRLREGDVVLEEGEFFIVPRGVEHLPVAKEEAYVLMFEPITTLNTGNVRNERTKENLESL
jgi:mannose-6-phosphate isomerase-like protein (cupin superfamily)